jgi:hypothetical protein
MMNRKKKMKRNSHGIVENQPGVFLDAFTEIVQASVKLGGTFYVFYRTRKATILSKTVHQWSPLSAR